MPLFKNKYRIKSTRFPGWDYSSNGMYFVTICTKNKTHYFGNIVNGKMNLNKHGQIANQYWTDIPTHFSNVHLDAYIIMPNHIHGILIIHNVKRRDAINRVSTGGITKTNNPMLNKSISRIIRWYKGRVTFEINKTGNDTHFAWQPRFHDHIIRNEHSLHHIRKYIQNNPTKWDRDEYNIR